MSRVKRFFVSHRVCFGLFVFVMAYQILVGNNLAPWRLNEHFITFYTVDYGMGFCSRFLPGAVYRLFSDQVNVSVLSAFSSAFLVLFFLALCFLLERVLLQAPRKEQTVCLFMILLFISGPASFTLFVKWLGVIDVYWIYLCLLFVFALANRRAWFLIPVLLLLAAQKQMPRLNAEKKKASPDLLYTLVLFAVLTAAGVLIYDITFFPQRVFFRILSVFLGAARRADLLSAVRGLYRKIWRKNSKALFGRICVWGLLCVMCASAGAFLNLVSYSFTFVVFFLAYAADSGRFCGPNALSRIRRAYVRAAAVSAEGGINVSYRRRRVSRHISYPTAFRTVPRTDPCDCAGYRVRRPFSENGVCCF